MLAEGTMTEFNEQVSELCAELRDLRQAINTLTESITDIRPRQDAALLDIQAAAIYLSTTRNSLYDLVKRGGIPCRRIGRKLVFVKAELDTWLQQLPGITVARAIASIKPEHREIYVRESVRIRYEDPELTQPAPDPPTLTRGPKRHHPMPPNPSTLTLGPRRRLNWRDYTTPAP
jgi:excisionase family DNA binding protein